MRSRANAAHQEAVSRRLELLRTELAQDWHERSEEPVALAAGDDWWTAHTLVPADDAPVEALAMPVPIPGRHAARRGTPLSAWMPEPLRGRVAVGPWHLVVVALLVSGALALTCWLLVRGKASALPPVTARPAAPLVSLTPSPVPAASAPAGALPSPASSVPVSSAAAVVTVDVEGKVRRPGIVTVPVGSRVTDALAAAGGVPRRDSLAGLNLAAVLVDGQQIVVGRAAAPAMAGAGAPGVGSASAGSSAAAGSPVNLNTATADELDTLPDVGPVTAASIIEWREENGGFTSVQELLEVDGIGPATLTKLTPHVTV